MLQELQEEVNRVNEEKVALETRIAQLQQEIQDGLDARKIHEKKGMTVVRAILYILQSYDYNSLGFLCRFDMLFEPVLLWEDKNVFL